MRIFAFVFLLSFGISSKAQDNVIEIVPAAVIPVLNEAEFYLPGWAVNANLYYENYRQYSLYGGVGVHQMQNRLNESGRSPFWGIQAYYGAQLNFPLIQDEMDIVAGGEAGWMLRLYTPNSVTSSSGWDLESSLGISPKIGWNWKPWDTAISFGVSFKYNIYFSMDPDFYFGNFANGIHQWMQPGLSLRFHI